MSMNYTEMGQSFNPFIYNEVDSFTVDIWDFYDEQTVIDDEDYPEDDSEAESGSWNDWATR